MDLSPEIIRALDTQKYLTPTPVQAAAITPMIKRQDLLVQAPTGTGKTMAFGIPIFENIDKDSRNIQCIILCPTRELVLQTANVLKNLSLYQHGIRSLALYGGEPIGKQINALRRKPQIILATPGRLLDHIRRRTIRLGQVQTVVLDEADRMLDMGFRDDIDLVFEQTPSDRQTVLFSATFSKEIQEIAALYQTDVKHITIKGGQQSVDAIEQYYTVVNRNAKMPALLYLLKKDKFPLSLIFVSTKRMADQISKSLNESGYKSGALHGDLKQSQRNAVMDQYRKGRINILVATDVAARGIDIKNIDAVINYDIPEDCDSYIHRIGRTGRANQKGISHTFLYPKERIKLDKIKRVTKATISSYPLIAFAPKTNSTSTSPARKNSSGKQNESNAASRNKYKKPYPKKKRSVNPQIAI